MFKAITAHSIKSNGPEIVDDLVRDSNEKLGVYRPSAGVLYASAPHDTEALKGILTGLTEAFPGMEIVGGTVVGGFTDDSGFTQEGYWLCLMVSDSVTLTAGCLPNISSVIQSNDFTEAFRASLAKDPGYQDAQACLFFSPYNHFDGEKFIDHVQEVLPENCLVFGGMAADYWDEQNLANFSKITPPAEKSLLFFAKDGVIHLEDDTVVYLLFQGEIEVQSGVSYGWSDVGMLFPACGNEFTLTEIDGKNPHTFLQEFQHPLVLEE
ncbi:FIST N-terminal domain-containing protein [Desulfosediminicola ganghwensis]|uniref:FIST N-terminal domain-containing protein n=1 Tax=Desulfosediminicola ganghwensis TaxID=2569540 RepID=UPI0010ACC3C9|nr:FIST N-terminal domain-containing protein [Desulfosediminicola ganghwensis]